MCNQKKIPTPKTEVGKEQLPTTKCATTHENVLGFLYLTIERHDTVGSFHSVVAWIECNWLHRRWGAVKAFIPDHIASEYRRFISFRCCLDRMQSCTSSTNLTICPIFGTYCTIGTNVTNQREVCMGVWGCLHGP